MEWTLGWMRRQPQLRRPQHQKVIDQLEDQVSEMTMWKPQQVHDLLLRSSPPLPGEEPFEDQIRAEDLRAAPSPLEAGRILVQRLADEMTERQRDFPVVNPIPEGLD
jgi:hypothetical protein